MPATLGPDGPRDITPSNVMPIVPSVDLDLVDALWRDWSRLKLLEFVSESRPLLNLTVLIISVLALGRG